MGNALHQATITNEYIGMVIDNLILIPIELGRQCFLGDGHSHRVGQPLTQGTGGGLDTGGIAVFGVTGGLRTQLPELL